MVQNFIPKTSTILYSITKRISKIYQLARECSNYPHIRNSIFHLRPKNVSHNMRLSGNEGQCFLYEGHKLIALHMSLQCLSTLI